MHAPAGFTVNNTISVTATATFAPGTTGAQVDVGILDSTASHAIASIVAASSPATVTATDLAPGTYVVEVDGDTGDPVDTSYTGVVSASSAVRPPPPTPNLATA